MDRIIDIVPFTVTQEDGHKGIKIGLDLEHGWLCLQQVEKHGAEWRDTGSEIILAPRMSGRVTVEIERARSEGERYATGKAAEQARQAAMVGAARQWGGR